MKKILHSKQMPAIVGTAAVLIFFIWGYIEGTFEHSWLIFIVAQLAVFVALAFRGDGSEEVGDEDEADETMEKAKEKADEIAAKAKEKAKGFAEKAKKKAKAVTNKGEKKTEDNADETSANAGETATKADGSDEPAENADEAGEEDRAV